MTSNRLQYAALVALFLLTLLVQGTFTADAVRDLTSDYPEAPVWIGRPWPTITSVRYPSEGSLVRPGQRVVTIEGQAPGGTGELARAVRVMRPGDRLPIAVESNGSVVEDSFVLKPVVKRATPFLWLYASISWFIMPWLSIGLGFWVAALRPRDRNAWLVLGILIGVAQMNRPGMLDPAGWPVPAAIAITAFRDLAIPVWAVCMMLFGMYFPQRWRFDRLAPWLKWVPIVPLSVIGAREAIASGWAIVDFRVGANLPLRSPGLIITILISTCISFFFAGLWDNRMSPDLGPDDKRRLKLLYWGCCAALTPLFFLTMYTVIRMGRGPDDREGLVLAIVFLMIFLFPLTMAYVLVVQRAMDVRVVVRQGMQYTLARGGIRIIQTAAIIVIAILAANVSGSERMSTVQRFTLIGFSALIAVRVRAGGDHLRTWVDRRFFREAYNAEHILGELSEQVRSILDRDALLQTVTRKISESLHVDKSVVMLLDGGFYRPALVTGFDAPVELAIPPDAPSVTELRRTREPVVLPAPSASAREGLAPLDAELLLPLASRKELLGFISLGPKKSEEPYTASDTNLLRSVATQTGLALENSRLSEEIAAETAARELLNREIEIAREVQQRLFPQNLPEVAALSYAGYCRPARGVGGDYYDFLALSSGKFGLAIGDVSGKGVPAALLMASLQASVRGQSQSGSGNVAELMTIVNRLVCDASPENRYATFLYAQFDPATKMMAYSNGGHNNPMVLRGNEVLRLEDGGPPVGLFRFSRYTQGEVQLQAGDLLVFFTDGVSEAENPAEEEWGEEPLIEAARACGNLPPAGMIQKIMDAADAFAAGAPQHDDMTLVVARVLE